MVNNKDNLYNDIIQIYQETTSVKETAERLETYPIKVRRVLITEGIWHSNTSDEIGSLYARGYSVSEIANALFISEKNVQSYLPYTRGQYGGDNRSKEAVRSEEYRERMIVAEDLQVNRKKACNELEQNYNKERSEINMDKLDVIHERNSQLEGKRPIPYAIKLHLELDIEDKFLSEEELNLLTVFGKMEKGITRDIIVPGDITLHALHYVINRAFGWQNSHLHCFRPYEEDFNKMIMTGKLTEWADLSGIYFRFPSDDYEDIYWDDDYEAGISVKTWLRKKYKGPYYYGGTREYYDRCQHDIKDLYKRYPTIEVRKSFEEYIKESKKLAKKTGNKDAKANLIKGTAPIRDVTVKELENSIYFEGGFDELIERIPLYDILLMPGMEQNFDLWDFMNRRTRKDCEDIECLAPVTNPILHALHYWYDYGDNWSVKITATACFNTRQEYEASGNPMDAIDKHRPVCVNADGLPVCDDVGGIHGYCNMLEIIYGDDPEEKESMRNWARYMGWTGRKNKPENIL